MTKLEYKLFMDNLKKKAGGGSTIKPKPKTNKSDKYNVGGVEDKNNDDDGNDHRDRQTTTPKKKYAVDG